MSDSSTTFNAVNLDQLLDKLGFTQSHTITASFILPIVNVFGLSFCSLSAWIFFRPKFTDPIYLYYRILCLVYILHLIHNFFYGLLFSPNYFWLNTYLSSLYHIYYFFIGSFLFLFEELLLIGILLSRTKFFSPFIDRNLKASPKTISLVFFSLCLVINFPFLFSFKIVPLENYYYFDTNGQKQLCRFYYFTGSDFGKTLISFTLLFLRHTLSLIFGVALNMFSLIKFTFYTRSLREEFEELEMSSIHNRPVTRREIEQINQRERSQRRIQKNMFYMAVTLCFVSIVSRVLLIISNVYFFYFFSFEKSLNIFIVVYSIYTFVTTVPIFIFYSFNQKFRDEMRRICSKREIVNQNFD